MSNEQQNSSSIRTPSQAAGLARRQPARGPPLGDRLRVDHEGQHEQPDTEGELDDVGRRGLESRADCLDGRPGAGEQGEPDEEVEDGDRRQEDAEGRGLGPEGAQEALQAGVPVGFGHRT